MRVITYSDPRKIEDIKEWNEIKKYPHLCVSQTLVQGLSRKCKRETFTILTTIEKMLTVFYYEWKGDTEVSLKQYFDITGKIKEINDEKLKNVFYKNRNEVLRAMRLLVEADVDLDDLNEHENTEEFKNFKHIYTGLIKTSNWNQLHHSKDKDLEALKTSYYEIIIDDIKWELEEFLKLTDSNRDTNTKDINNIGQLKQIYKNSKKTKETSNDGFRRKTGKTEEQVIYDRLSYYFKFVEEIDNYNLEKVVLHGIHQFTPLITRFIKHLEYMGVEVIFLIHYNKTFKNVYETWENVYSWTGCEFEINQIDSTRYSKQLAREYSKVILGNLNNLEMVNDTCTIFENLTEYGNYVADIYSKASTDKDGRGRSNAQILAKMEEQFYSVNGEQINNLLSVYFPEQFGEKHFLSYPIGQFIFGLYNMWDFDNGTIRINDNILKECLAVNLWTKESDGVTPIQLFEKFKSYFIGIEEIDEYIDEINTLRKYCDLLKMDKYKEEYDNYKHLSFFNTSVEEVDLYKNIIVDLKNIAEKIFKDKKNVNIKEHYRTLMMIIKEKIKINDSVSKDELSFVEEIFNKLSEDGTEVNASIEEIKHTLHFYLQQKSQDASSNWIVRDFEQIDGGVFLADVDAKEGYKEESNKIYHYAEISDSNMSSSKHKQLPWPLTDSSFKNSNELIDTYLLCRDEYSNFLKNILFYGMYYLDKDFKISYIKKESSEIENTLYFIFKLINLEEKPNLIDNYIETRMYEKLNRHATELIDSSKISIEEVRMMSFCKKRFYYEGLVDGFGSYTSEFLSKRFVKILFSLKVLEKINDERCWSNDKKILEIIQKRIDDGNRLIKSWSRESADIKAYILATIKKYRKGMKAGEEKVNIDEEYKEIKKNFLEMKFTNGDSDEVKYVSKYINNNLIDNIVKYIKYDDEENAENISFLEQCKACKYEELCSNVYRERGL